jgi:hypothetical protein
MELFVRFSLFISTMATELTFVGDPEKGKYDAAVGNGNTDNFIFDDFERDFKSKKSKQKVQFLSREFLTRTERINVLLLCWN